MNQIEPSARSTRSFGLLSRWPSHASASVVSLPSGSTRVTDRLPWWQCTTRPRRSTIRPFAYPAGERQTPTAPVVSSQRSTRSLGMSLNRTLRQSGEYAGPSSQRPSSKSTST